MYTPDIAIPLAYFITYTCYGTWLHGEKITAVDQQHNIPGTAFLTYHQHRLLSVKNRLLEPPYVLDNTSRFIVLQTIQQVCAYRQWTLLAAHIRSNHVHLVIHALIAPELIMNAIKSYTTRYLNEANPESKRKHRWTRHGSTQYLWSKEEVEATIRYVIDEQGQPMAMFENHDRVIIASKG